MKKKILIATQNLGKLKEFEIALSSFFDIFLSLKSFSDQDEVEENGMTYQENAHLKAIYFYEKYHVPVIADDSGLEVISLQHYPGIYSARIGENDEKRRQIILNKLEGITSREAQMMTHLTYIDASGIYDFEARVDGRISFKEVGHQGFGYDSIFIPNGYLETFSCMQPEEKLKVSHRGIAIKQLIQFIKEKSYAS